MKGFINDNILLFNKTAVELYNNVAKNQPIYDYHCHLSAKEIYEDKVYPSITDLWIEEDDNGHAFGDHYKWRLMRANGVSEKYITGDGDKKEKFIRWADTLSYAFNNPLFVWSHLELKRYFDIDEVLTKDNASRIYDEIQKKMPYRSTRTLIKMSNVDTIITTDDPCSNLEYHDKLNSDATFETKIYPSFRPDSLVDIDKSDFIDNVKLLEKTTSIEIVDLRSFLEAIDSRVDFFNSKGCYIADHGVLDLVYEDVTCEEANSILQKALSCKETTRKERNMFQTYMLVHLGKKYKELSWAQQYHLQALRNINKDMFDKLGKDTGFDAMDDKNIVEHVGKLLSKLNEDDNLPKTIIYSLNPKDYEALLATCYCFQKDYAPSKIQFGAAWWFLDHRDGMERQFKALSNFGLFGHFIGMLTDSRSFLSYARHEYFRRVLCSYVGDIVEKGEFPNDKELLENMIKNICYGNAKKYFNR